MRHKSVSFAAFALLLASCGKDSSGPSTSPEAARAIARFTFLADSVTAAGDPETGQVFTGAADAVRMSGDVSTISISVDGSAAEYNALTLSLHVPGMSDCDEYECYETEPLDENLLLAWREEVDPSVMFIATMGTGTHSVAIDTTTPVEEEPISTPPMGLALFGSESGEGWFSTAGTATNAAVSTASACARPKTETPGVRFTCSRATYRWSANFTADEAEGDDIGAKHNVVIAASNVSGARVVLADMSGAAASKMGRSPIMTRLSHRRDRSRGLR